MSEFEFWKDIGNISEAIMNYQKKNAEFNNRFINPWIRLGNMIEREDRSTEIVQAYQHATEVDPVNSRNWIDLGDTQLKAGAYEEAVTAYQKAVELEPKDGWLISNLALALSMLGRYEEAIPLYADSIELLTEDKDRAVSWNRLGDMYRKINDYQKAFLSFQRADELEGRYIRPGSELKGVDLPDGGQEIPSAEELADDMGDDPLTNFEKLHVQPAQVEAEAAEALTENVEVEDKQEETELLPEWLSESQKTKLTEPASQTRNNRAPEWLTLKGNFEINTDAAATETPVAENAEETSDQTKGPHEAEPLLVDEAIRFVEDDEAQKFFVDASKEQTNEAAYNEYLKDAGEPMKILSDHVDEIQTRTEVKLSEALSVMETRNAQVWNEMGNVYLKSGAYDDAIAAYGKAIELERHFAWPYSNLALAYVQKSFFAEAILLYQRSIELFTTDKDKAITWNRLGNLYRRTNDYDHAIAAYQTADELDPENATLSLRSSFGLLGSISEAQANNLVSQEAIS